MTDIEDLAGNKYNPRKIKNLLFRTKYSEEDEYSIKEFIKDMINIINESPTTFIKKDWTKASKLLGKKHSVKPSTVTLNYFYRKLIVDGEIDYNIRFEWFNVKKNSRTNSGITQITVVSSPYPNGSPFSCEHDCYYCPNEPAREENGWQAQPRSYLYDEPGVRRANTNKFDSANQMWDRMTTLLLCGLPIDKIEALVLGGTWGSYPEDYREEFIRDMYYAANTFYDDADSRRERLSLEEEIEINMTAPAKIIGLTLETRPDHVTAREIELLRKYNCTRVQIGIQHTDKKILSKINRGCYIDDAKRAIYNLLNVGLKVDVHLMFDLPFASPDDDMKMIDTMLTDEDLRFDQAKLYPFASVDWTKTKEWEDKGMDLHYPAEDLMEVLIYAMSRVHPWIRLNRVIRDIPSDYIHAGNDVTNLRQMVMIEMEKRGLKSMCIRSREVKNKPEAINNIDKAELCVRKYNASMGTEYFISIESPDNKYIYGFCRLRLSNDMGVIRDIKARIHRKTKNDSKEKYIILFPELNNVAMIRELHVYGNVNPVDMDNMKATTQHRGFGKKLVAKAEEIARNNSYEKIAVISGVGVRKYYEKIGYTLGSYDYMYKDIKKNNNYYFVFLFFVIYFIFRCFF
jgi:ELP3 family radical SAM enzyme/protein acetyltransferase